MSFNNNLINIISNQLAINLTEFSFFNKLAIFSIFSLPIFHLTFNDWTGYWVVLSSLFCLISIIQDKVSLKIVLSDPRSKWIIIGFLAYPVAIFMSQICLGSLDHKPYLDTSPFLYFIPVFIFISWKKIDMGKWIQMIMPLVIITAFWSSFYHHPEISRSQWGDRLTVYFSDPLAFGQIILALGLMCLSNIQFNTKMIKDIILTIWSLLGFLIGVYLSIESGSRTGWLAIPMVLFIILSIKLNWRPSISIPLGLVLTILICFIFYNLSSVIYERVNLAILEIKSYPWSGGVASDTSVGLRITFQRLGWFYFSQSPICGWGEVGYIDIKNSSEVISFSSQYARDFVSSALFHNELMTNMVRSGLFGIMSYFLAVLVPLYFCIKFIHSDKKIIGRAALLGACFLICQIVAGMSDEFLNLKGMVAFYAYLISVLLGTILGFSNPLTKNSFN